MYEGLHDRVISLPGFTEPCNSDVLPREEIADLADLTLATSHARNEPQDLVTVDECKSALDQMLVSLKKKLECGDQRFPRGVLKFADRAKKMPTSKLTTCFHTFGSAGVCNTRLTATAIVKRAKRGKIHVQPESVKRRKVEDGSRRRLPQGQTARNNPFKPMAGKTKRAHKFA